MFVLKTLGGIALGATLAAGAMTSQVQPVSIESNECVCCDCSCCAPDGCDCCCCDPVVCAC